MSKLAFANSIRISTSSTYLKNVYWYRSQYTLKKKDNAQSLKNSDILYKSKNYLIVNKPYDLMMYKYSKRSSLSTERQLRSKIDPNPSLINLLIDKFPYLYDPSIAGGFHILHRLDSVTSGCICKYISLID
jgi:23S rRNA-/tRNA-specific pseudouridylate synthase